MARLELAASWSQTRRPTNWATPGYEVEGIFPKWSNLWSKAILDQSRGEVKKKKCQRRNGFSGWVISMAQIVLQLPKQERCQLCYTRLFRSLIRLGVFTQSGRNTHGTGDAQLSRLSYRDIFFIMRAAGGVTQLRKPVLLYTENEEKAIPKFAFPPQHRECGIKVAEAGRIW